MAENKYTPSQAVREAGAAVEEQKKKKPEYQSGWEEQLKGLMERILNREDFRYDLNGDALYRRYLDQAARGGKLAMEDTMAQAAALTGGYGNSYAQTAGQQVYARELDGVADRIPELYALALDQYRQQTQGLQQKYDLLAGLEKQDYGRYQDALAAWQREADQLWRSYTDSRDFDYNAYRNGIADWKWQMDFDEDLRRYERDWADKHPFAFGLYPHAYPAASAVPTAPAASPVPTGPNLEKNKPIPEKEHAGKEKTVTL